MLVLYLSNTHCLFLPVKNLLFELSCLFEGCHFSLCLLWTATSDYKNHYQKRHLITSWSSLGARWGDEEPPENETGGVGHCKHSRSEFKFFSFCSRTILFSSTHRILSFLMLVLLYLHLSCFLPGFNRSIYYM